MTKHKTESEKSSDDRSLLAQESYIKKTESNIDEPRLSRLLTDLIHYKPAHLRNMSSRYNSLTSRTGIEYLNKDVWGEIEKFAKVVEATVEELGQRIIQSIDDAGEYLSERWRAFIKALTERNFCDLIGEYHNNIPRPISDFIGSFRTSAMYMIQPTYIMVNDDKFRNDVDPIYFVNGIWNTLVDAIQSAELLSNRLRRRVYLIYNPTSLVYGNITEDIIEAIYDMVWPVDAYQGQANLATRQVSYMLYRAAKQNKPVSIVSHSQGCIIVRNACFALGMVGMEDYVVNQVAWVCTGSPLNENVVCPRPTKYKSLRNPNDFVAQIVGVSDLPDTTNLPEWVASHAFTEYVEKIDANMLWQLNPVSIQAGIFALGFNADGGQEIFYIKENGIVEHRYQPYPNAKHWDGPFGFYGLSASEIALGRNKTGEQEIFYIQNGKIHHYVQKYANAPEWNGPYHFYDISAKQIAVSQNLNGKQELFYIGPDSKIYHRYQETVNASAWEDGQDFYGISGAKQIAVGCNANGGQELFWLTEEGKVFHRYQPRANSGNWDGPFTFYENEVNNVTYIAVGQNQNGRQEFFYIKNGDIYHYLQSAANSLTWDYLGNFYDVQATRIALGRNENGGQEIFYTLRQSSNGYDDIWHYHQPYANAPHWDGPHEFYKTIVLNRPYKEGDVIPSNNETEHAFTSRDDLPVLSHGLFSVRRTRYLKLPSVADSDDTNVTQSMLITSSSPKTFGRPSYGKRLSTISPTHLGQSQMQEMSDRKRLKHS